ncbi:MAG: hypothetical protein A2252_05935 [Elusimicrobia bacterium RIFOXYA2_FULL_39_19]|nr:MAG: hypothetical protein A2252_05935 [Elusimicrobia bacterium RIFOXYA2_FULL_39_19]
MKNYTASERTFFIVLVMLVIVSCLAIFLPQGIYTPKKELPTSKINIAVFNAVAVIFVYGGLGLAGLRLSRKIGFTDMWESGINNKQRFLIPAVIGFALGAVFIVGDIIFGKFHGFGSLPHPPFPLSIAASFTAGFGEEMIFRLFFVSFWVWLISGVFLKNRFQDEIFWGVSAVSAAFFAVSHFPVMMVLYDFKSISEIPQILMVEIILLNGLLSLFTAYYFRKYGYLAAVGIHFWADIVWHVLWGLK